MQRDSEVSIRNTQIRSAELFQNLNWAGVLRQNLFAALQKLSLEDKSFLCRIFLLKLVLPEFLRFRTAAFKHVSVQREYFPAWYGVIITKTAPYLLSLTSPFCV